LDPARIAVGQASIHQVKTQPSPLDIATTQRRLRQLAEQLSLEYAGAVAPGRVLRLVLGTGRRLRSQGYVADDLLRITKSAVRTDLATLIGSALSARTLAHATT
jgi:hypothetical protein